MTVSKTTERLFNLALETAKLSNVEQYYHGAVITSGSVPLVLGVNTKDKTHPLSHSPWTCHAEFKAIIKIGTDTLASKRGKITLYSARVGPGGIPRMSKPCENCMKFIREARIDRVVWWDRDTKQIEICKVKDM